MDEVGRSAWLKVGPNDARPKHEPGRGQVTHRWQRANPAEVREDLMILILGNQAGGVKPERGGRAGRMRG